ncbi:MAG: dihydrofolate reductase [Lachnospiraceae bacterium]|nr:dihydrofolate reductase [Lachnospiraceae bacterium]
MTVRQFHKLVEVGPVGLMPWAEKELEEYAKEIIRYDTLPGDNAEILRRIGDADAVLVRTQPRIDAEVLSKAPNLKYVGMCCSLYSKESANVDIDYAQEHGITVYGIRDYGDRGVVEYVLYQLIRILHGYDYPMWKEKPLELTGMKVGMVGLGVSGGMTADALAFLGAKVSYYARSKKPEREAMGMHYQELIPLLKESDVVITALNKNVILLKEEEFKALGEGKIMINTSIGPAADLTCLAKWVENPKNIFCSDTYDGIGAMDEAHQHLPNVLCTNASAGMTKQGYDLMSKKVLDNIRKALD